MNTENRSHPPKVLRAVPFFALAIASLVGGVATMIISAAAALPLVGPLAAF